MKNGYQYSFITIWKIKAPINDVWKVIYEQEKWPEWWKGVIKVETLAPGDQHDMGKKNRLTWKSFLPYELKFNVVSTKIDKPFCLEGNADGELAGTGKWYLQENKGITTVQYNWDVNTTKKWMNLLAPLLKPLFKWNHDIVMRWGAKGLAKKLNTELLSY